MEPGIHLIDVQGHRGCRGLLPENTIVAFKEAIQIGVTTLELDVVVSRDYQIIISHEPFFNHEISIGPNELIITKESELEHSIFQLSYDEIQRYDVGSKVHPRFLDQHKTPCHKPSLKDMVTHVDTIMPDIKYNIELKRKPEWESYYLPDLNTFVDLFLATIKSLGIEKRLTIQSFDLECLQNLKRKTDIPLVLLIDNLLSIEKNIELLGFKPEVYSPNHKLVDKRIVNYCKKHQIKLIPWTANTSDEINKLLDFKVDGIISDYPDKLIQLINKRSDIEIL